MKNMEMFSTDKTWYKGNIHTHSTVSDGGLEPKKVADLYYQQGYNFLAFTEHEIFSWWKEFRQQDLLILPGIEIGTEKPKSFQRHHIVGIGNAGVQEPHLKHFDNKGFWELAGAQAIIDFLNERGYLSIYCHPVWSRRTFAEITNLKGFTAIEIYNNICYLKNNTGYATYYWDTFLRQGRVIWGVATDDSHQELQDYGGGWVVVNSAELEVTEITNSLKRGNFYSSNGPAIEAYGVNKGQVYVRCSPVESIHFVSFERRGKSFHREKNQHLTEAAHKLHGDEKYVRIEIVDERGKKAWSNPIFL